LSSNVAASVHARLLNRAQARGEVFELFLVRYAGERFLYRLGVSAMRERCTLKGAGLLTFWMPDPYRSTRDLDFLASGPSDERAVRELLESVCIVTCPEDALAFDLASLSIMAIRDEQRYQGQRAVLRAMLGKARIRVQIDFGFGDALPAEPEEAEMPTLLDHLPAPVVRVYPQVASIAEKFEAMVQLGRRNSRMKDLHDLWALSEQFEHDGAALRDALSRCFARRGTEWSAETPVALTAGYYVEPEVASLWSNYHRRGQFRQAPPQSMEVVGDRLRAFLGPVRAAILAGEAFDRHWTAGGPWR
jgi:hypothetical protein